VSTEREVIDRRLLAAKIVDTDLRIWHTTAVAGLDVRLVLLVTITFRWTARGKVWLAHMRPSSVSLSVQ